MNWIKKSPTVQTAGLILVAFIIQKVGLFAGLFTIHQVYLALPVELNPWTVLTSVYAHGGPGHLIDNLIALVIFGLLVERVTTLTRYHAFFITTGVVAGLAEVFVGAAFGAEVLVVGASGAIFGLMGYFLTGNVAVRGLFDSVNVGWKGKMLTVIVISVLITVMTAGENVALVAHATGLIIGGVCGFFKILHK